MNAFPWHALSKPITAHDRERLSTWLRAMLQWQRTLGAWPRPPRTAPDATPFVTLYEHGRVRGCVGFAAGPPSERAVRAFLNALADSRFAGANERTRKVLVAQISYAVSPRPIAFDAFLETFEPGTHGAVFVPTGAPAAVLLPQVARDGRLDARGFLDALARKARLQRDDLAKGTLHLFHAESVGSRAVATGDEDAVDRAAAWLARQVAREGSIRFAVDPHTGADLGRGTMYHGRAATLVHALAAHGGYASVVTRARRWLAREIDAALASRAVEAWPADPAMIAGTLALAVRAGLDVRSRLRAFVQETARAQTSAWHAAQVVTALGTDAPRGLWASCVRDLETRPFAPWTALAARAVGDASVLARTERALVESIRRDAPHRGGAAVTSVPETALTAIVVEALAASRDASAKHAVRRAREFLRALQFTGERLPVSIDPAVGDGAFPASPVNATLRCDITAHALLALRSH
jgi:AMMECR1 domain-containing protein